MHFGSYTITVSGETESEMKDRLNALEVALEWLAYADDQMPIEPNWKKTKKTWQPKNYLDYSR